MQYETVDNFVRSHGEETLYDFLRWLNQGRSYKSIGKILGLSPSRVCRLAQRIFNHTWVLSEATQFAIEHRHRFQESTTKDNAATLAELVRARQSALKLYTAKPS